MRRFFARLLFLLPVLAGMLLTNWFVDPDHIREPDAYARGIARLLLEGKPVTNISQPDEAAVMEYYFAGLSANPDVVVIGSSRVKQLRSDSFPGRTFFNASISGASMTDYMAITNLMESRGGLPRTMVIELSTFLLSNEIVSVWPRFEVQQKVLEAHFQEGQPVPAMEAEKTSLKTYARFLSPDYFQLSFFTFLDTRLGDAQGSGYHILRPGEEPTGLTYLADGSEIFPPQRRKNLGKESVTALAIDAGEHAAGIPKTLDKERQQVLEAYLSNLQSRRVRVILFLGPYHPTSYEIMLGNSNRIVVDIQKYYEELAQRYGFQIVGSFNPADLNLSGAVYFDATHITPEALAGLFAGVK
jgi:hypothetical protein